MFLIKEQGLKIMCVSVRSLFPQNTFPAKPGLHVFSSIQVILQQVTASVLLDGLQVIPNVCLSIQVQETTCSGDVTHFSVASAYKYEKAATRKEIKHDCSGSTVLQLTVTTTERSKNSFLHASAQRLYSWRDFGDLSCLSTRGHTCS